MRWFSRRSREQDLDEEIRANLAIAVKQRMEAGDTREAAERAALREFGSVALSMEATRETWGRAWWAAFAQDLKFGARTLRKAPAFTAVAVVTLALGIGASTAVFSVVEGILFRPLPYPDAGRIAMVWKMAPLSAVFGGLDYPWGRFDFTLYQRETKAFASLGAFRSETFNLTGHGEPVFLEGMRATAGFFPSLGVRPALGRFFRADEDRPGHELVAVLGDRVWRERFNADRSIVGRTIALNGLAYAVVGVMPPSFSFPHAEEMPAALEFPREAELWTPLAIPDAVPGPSDMAVVGRLRPGATLDQVKAELDVFASDLERINPSYKAWARARPVPLETQIIGDARRPLLLLLGAVALVLLIACSNVAGLVLTRSLGRHREFRLRSALGAGRRRLLRQLLTESLLLAAVGGALALALAAAGVQFVRSFGPANLPRLQEVSLDTASCAFCAAATLLTGLIFGLTPAIGMGRDNLAESLKGGVRVAGSPLPAVMRSALLVGQIALALVLAVAAGLLGRTFYELLASDGGFKPEHVLTFELSLPASRYPDPEHITPLYRRALDKLRVQPGVESVGMVHAVPMGGAPDATGIRVPGRILKRGEMPYANYMFASPGYFATVRTPLLRGREFLDTDTLDAVHVTIVNRAMADALWPGQDAIGKQVGVGLVRYPARVVVGVVANVKQNSLRDEDAPQMYVPYSQNEIAGWPPMETMQVAVRTSDDPARATAGIRQAMRSVDPDLPLAKVATLTALRDRSLTQPRFAMLLLSGFGVLALLLAAIGMYGVISHSVTQRTQEIGIRVALGADKSTVFRMVLGQGARLAGAGISAGLIGAFAVTRTMANFLYGVRPFDPATFAAVAVLLGGIALLACHIPARRAMRVDPVIALRHE
jgi:predicted permease